MNDKSRNQYNTLSTTQKDNFNNIINKIVLSMYDNDFVKFFYKNKTELMNDLKLYNWGGLLNKIKSKMNASSINEILKYYYKRNISENLEPNIKPFLNTSPETDSSDHCQYSDAALYFYQLPIEYKLYLELNIYLNLNINLIDIIQNNFKKINIKRKTKCDQFEIFKFIFSLKAPFIVFENRGDSNKDNCGHLIIKLNLEDQFIWNKQGLIILYSINLYQMLYGVNLSIKLGNFNQEYDNWIPYHHGWEITFPNFDLKDFNGEKKDLIIKFILNYQDTHNNKKILLNYFNK